jgi:hypothetical protein
MSPDPVLLPSPRFWERHPDTADTSGFREIEDLHPVVTFSSSLHPEGYRISVSPHQLEVQVGGNTALRYAWQHFRQLQGDQPEVTPCGVLEDSPAFDRRAFMLDVSRCKVPNERGFQQWLHLLSAFRYNELQLYTEHTFAYPGHREVWQEASPMTPEDIIRLQEQTAALGITLVPNQNCFGHFERWIRHDAYKTFAEAPDGFTSPWGDFRPVGSVLKPDDASFSLVTGLLDELLPLFTSSRVNLGCDETFELGQGASRERCEREGTGAVYAGFVSRIMAYVKEHHHKQPEFWGDILIKHPEEIGRLPADAHALCWGYEADSPLSDHCRIYAESGHSFTVCPGTSSWRSFAGRTDNMIANLQAAAKAADTWEADGLLLTDWGDCGHLQQEPVSYGPMALCALAGWQGPSASPQEAWAWCDEVAFERQAGDTLCWLDAGRISEQTGISPSNSSMLFQWFLNPDSPHGQSVGLETLDHIREQIDSLNPPACFREEWEQTLRNLRLSVALARDHRSGSDRAAPLLEAARKHHAALWRQRNREGGLAESLEHYTNARNVNPRNDHD